MSRSKPDGLTSQTSAQYKQLQRDAARVIMRPLTIGWHTQRIWEDGSPTAEYVSAFIKPNDRLSSFERIEIYNRQYWYRLIDCLYDDFPGVRAVLGRLKFNRLLREYLTEHPSTSFTLRNLGDRLPPFIAEHADMIGSRTQLAEQMAQFEWAQILAFDEASRPVIGVDDLLGKDAEAIRIGLQPHITLLELGWPLDQFAIALKRSASRGDASNAVEETDAPPVRKLPRLPKPAVTFLVVHRFQNAVYFKQLTRLEYRLLSLLRNGESLARACELAIDNAAGGVAEIAATVQSAFALWANMGWFCKRAR